jgi:hypothetical protein
MKGATTPAARLYHAISGGFERSVEGIEKRWFKLAAEIDIERVPMSVRAAGDTEVCEAIYLATESVHGPWFEKCPPFLEAALGPQRSTSTGDVVLLGDKAFFCAPVGWKQFDLPPGGLPIVEGRGQPYVLIESHLSEDDTTALAVPLGKDLTDAMDRAWHGVAAGMDEVVVPIGDGVLIDSKSAVAALREYGFRVTQRPAHDGGQFIKSVASRPGGGERRMPWVMDDCDVKEMGRLMERLAYSWVPAKVADLGLRVELKVRMADGDRFWIEGKGVDGTCGRSVTLSTFFEQGELRRLSERHPSPEPLVDSRASQHASALRMLSAAIVYANKAGLIDDADSPLAAVVDPGVFTQIADGIGRCLRDDCGPAPG